MASADLQTIDWAQMAHCLFSDSRDALLIIRTSDLRITQVNPRARQLTGFPEQQLLLFSLDDLLSAEDQTVSRELFDSCRQCIEFDRAGEFHLQRAFGEPLPVSVTLNFVLATPEILGIVTVRDESQPGDEQQDRRAPQGELHQTLLQRTAKLELNEAELRRTQYKQLIDDIDAIAWEANYPFNGMTYVSNQLESMLGYVVEDWTSDSEAWTKAIVDEDRTRVVRAFLSNCEQAEDHELEYRVRTADGRVFWLSNRVHIVKDDAGQPEILRGVIVNVTDRKEAQQQTRQREAEYRLLVDNAPVCIHSIDENRRLSSINPAGFCMVGASRPADVLGRRYMSFVDQPDQERIERLLEQAYCGQRSEFDFICAENGQRRIFKSNFIPIEDSDGVVRKVIGTAEDITARRQAEEKLRWSEEMFRQLAENINAVFWMCSIDDTDHDGYVSPMYDVIWGRSSADERDKVKSMATAIVAEDQAAHTQAMSRLRQEGVEFDIEYQIQRPDGQVRWIRDRGFLIRDEWGTAVRLAGLAEDITNRIKTLEKLRIQDRAIAYAEAGIVIADARLNDMPIVFCNPAFERMTGYSPQEALGRNCRFLQANDTDQPAVKNLRKAIKEGRECRAVLRNYRKDGTMFWNEVSVSPVHDQSGQLTHFVGFWNDISERVAGESRLRDSEHRFRTLCRDAPMGILLTDVDGDCHYINDIGAQIVGQSREEIYGDGWTRSLHPDDRQRVLATWKRAVSNQDAVEFESRFCHADGSIAWVNLRANARLSDQGELIGYVGSFIDITDRKKTLKALEQSERRYRTLIEDAPEAIMVADIEDARFVDWNEATLRLLRTDAETIATKSVWDFFPDKQPDGRDSIEAAHEMMTASLAGESPAFEWTHIDSQGNEIPSEVRLTGLKYGGRQLVRGTVTDVSERRAAEEQLRRTRLAVESTSDAMFVINDRGQFIDVNQTACDRLGFTRDELLGMTVSGINPNYPIEVWPGHWRDLKESGKSVYESVHVKKDGTVIPVEISKSLAKVGAEEFAFAFVRDITERKQVEAILESTQFAVDHNISAIVRINSQGRLTYVNEAACNVLQYSREELLAMHIWDIDLKWPRNEWPVRWNQIKQAGSSTTETIHRCKDGTHVDCEVTACYFSFDGEDFVFAFCLDITQRNEAQLQLRQRETQLAHVSRLSTMGEMVAGIAHEVNQPLYSILNFAKATKNNLQNPSEENLQQIEHWNVQIREAAKRAGDIIKRLRTYVSREPAESSLIEIHPLIQDTIELIAHEIKRAGVTIETDFPPHNAVVFVDRVQIQQVLVNLLVNAIEAMERIELDCRKVAIGTRQIGQDIEVWVADSGPGFPQDQERNLFDPFVSTKADGMGMGLAISNTIIESFGGQLSVRSNDAGGATFLFTLPVVENHV